MRIRNDLAKTAMLDFVSETFSKFEFNLKNVGNLLAVKLYINNNFDKITDLLSKDGYINITEIEDLVLPDFEKLGKFEVPAFGTKYIFTSDDVKRLIAKLKGKAEV